MSELFAAFRQHLIWSLILWVMIFTAFTALFASGRLIAFATGLGRVLASIVATPFVFIRRAVVAVMGHTAESEERYRSSDQYLLNKGMLVLQAMVIVLAVGALSAAVVVTYNALVPPSEVRRAARDYAKDVAVQRQASADASSALTSLDTAWAQKEQAEVAAYRKERQTQISAATKELASTENSIRSYGGPNAVGTLESVKQTINSRSAGSPDDINRTKRRIDSIVDNNWYWLGDWRSVLQQWNQRWWEKTYAEYELSSFSVEDLRSAKQPEYQEAKAKRDREAELLASMEQNLVERQETASLKWKAAFFRALRAFVAFLLFVWLMGAVIEGGWMAVRIADDVRRIRESAPEKTPESVAAAEVRMPIRDTGLARPVSPAET